MSLVCYECDQLLGPSLELPGREATMVYPHVQSLVYLPTPEGIGYKIGYIQAPHNRSLCFRCIEGQLPEKNKESVLKPIYECYEAEMKFRGIEEEQKTRWADAGDLRRQLDAYEKFERSRKNVASNCVFCGNGVENENPFFVAVVIDRVHSSQHLGGLPGESNYQWSNFETGMTSFRFCFEDFRKYFPRSFEQLSYDMLGEKNPNFRKGQSELHIGPEFEKALFEKTGKTISELLGERVRKDLKIIRTDPLWLDEK